MTSLPGKTPEPASPESTLDFLDSLIAQALRAGADAADAALSEGASLSVTWREGRLETLERSESADLGLRVFAGTRQALVATTDRRPEALATLVERAVAMAKAAPEDPFCGLADPSLIARSFPDLKLEDDEGIGEAALLMQAAREAEDAARAVPGVTRCESAQASASCSRFALAASNGFRGNAARTVYGIGVSALAGEGTEMEQDHDEALRLFRGDLPAAADIGRRAGERAASHRGGRKMPTCRVPVLFNPRAAGGLLRHLAGAISGPGIARGTSFLKDHLGKRVFPESVTITDDPFRPRGLRSRLFDGEGLAPVRRAIVDKGVLTTWLLDLRSARQLGLAPTSHASRSAGGLPSPSPANLWLEPGALTPEELMKDVQQGFYVTELMGDGVNGVTGDYSRAARGFWIENGERAFPVHEVTIAGNLKDMFARLVAANDLEFRHGIDSPTVRVDNLMVGGA